MRRVIHVILSVVIVVVLVYVGLMVFLYLMQGRLLYYPTREIEATPAQMGLAYEDVTLEAADGVKLAAWFVPADKPGGVVLFCHGNGGNICHRLPMLRMLHGMGLSTLIFDYRGYGQSQGSPDEKGTYLDAEAAWEWLVRERGVPPSRIVVQGRSLGGSVAAHLAASRTPAALIVESSFTSVPDIAAELYPLFPARLLSRFKYDTLQGVRQARCPLLVVHSRDDEMIPFRHAERLFEAAREPKEFLEISGGHNEGFMISEVAYKKALGDFVARHVGQ